MFAIRKGDSVVNDSNSTSGVRAEHYSRRLRRVEHVPPHSVCWCEASRSRRRHPGDAFEHRGQADRGLIQMASVDLMFAAQDGLMVSDAIPQEAYPVNPPVNDLPSSCSVRKCLVESAPPDIVEAIANQKCPEAEG